MSVSKERHQIPDVDNQKFYNAIVEYRKRVKEAELQGLEKPRLPEYIGECIFRIALKLSYHRWYINYTFKDEMVADAMATCVERFDNFDPEITKNPFAYFMQITWYAFLGRMAKEEKARYIMYKFAEQKVTDETDELTELGLYDNISEFIERYEKRENEKKERKKSVAKSKKNNNAGSN